MKKTLTLLGLVLASINLQAQTWEKLVSAPTGTFQIEADFNGDVYLLGPTNASNIFVKKFTESTFSLLPGGGILNDISVYDKKMFGSGGLSKGNNIYSNYGTGWGPYTPSGQLDDLEYNGSTIFGCNAIDALYEGQLNANFALVAGTAKKVAKAKDGTTIIANGTTTQILKNSQWVNISTTIEMVSITASSISNVWAVDNLGDVYQYNNGTTSWVKKNGSNMKSISIDGDQEIWALGNDGFVYYAPITDPKSRYTTWTELSITPPASPSLIEVADNGDLYVIGQNVSGKGNIYVKKTTDPVFSFLAGNGLVTDIAVHSNKIVGVGTGNVLYEHVNNAWQGYAPGKAYPNIDFNASMMLGCDVTLKMYSKLLSTQNNTWSQVPGTYSQVSIATDNTIVAINGVSSYITKTNTTFAASTVLSNNQSLSSVAVGSYNNIWGINAEGNIYYFNHTTSTWEKKLVVPSGAKSISLYEDNAIYAIGIDNKIYKAELSSIITSIDEKEINESETVYPNPTSAEINFIGKGELLNLSGKKVAEGNNSINLSNLTNGLYYLKTETGTHKVIKK